MLRNVALSYHAYHASVVEGDLSETREKAFALFALEKVERLAFNSFFFFRPMCSGHAAVLASSQGTPAAGR